MQIAPSILAADFSRLADEVAAVGDAADWVHVDVMDYHFVPNLTIGLPVVESLLKHTSLPLDCHLMIEDPDRWAPSYAEAGARSVTFHAEAAQAPVRLARTLRAAGSRAGLGLRPATTVDSVAALLPEIDMLLLMTVEPGFGGQSFLDGMLPKIRRARELVRDGEFRVAVQVDGGIDDDTIGRCAEAGADVFVAGSAVYGADDPEQAARRLRGASGPGRERRLVGGPGMSSILVVDDDPEIAHFIELALQTEGFDVQVAHGGDEALGLIDATLPDLAMLDVMMPGIDGVELVRRLRAGQATASLPIIMLTAQSLPAEKIAGLTAGADDYLVKPFDTLELIARVRSTLRRNADMRSVSPLTGLPGNHRITEAVAARTASGERFAVCHLDLDNFKAFNDRHGWIRGDEVIGLLAKTLKLAAAEAGSPPPFVGHVGGDDFVALCTPEQVEPMCRRIVEVFDTDVRELYEPEEVEAGFVTILDRQGHERRYPLTSVSIGVATTERRRYDDPREVVAVATEMKAVAKGREGSAVAIDRRTDGTPTTA